MRRQVPDSWPQGEDITVTVPTGTHLPSNASDYTVMIDGSGTSASSVTVNGNTVQIPVPQSIPASANVDVQISDVTNPAVGSYPDNQFSVATATDGPASPTTQGGQITFNAPTSGSPTPTGMSLNMQEDASNPGNVSVRQGAAPCKIRPRLPTQTASSRRSIRLCLQSAATWSRRRWMGPMCQTVPLSPSRHLRRERTLQG